ncbi:transporter substrate-binding domain-containing protein [Leeia sp. TBRC 13508]|uniref:Transporter substrate-binding domain-containing protein n=1 Tax=Leeia speluncae TaxID=2884804 RepID=A0ABS8DA79_9NEIS|nr:transporter substrate-binding domain-containing protein [Leeia speluncae]MCB6184918.1 transporter substrate-binding domain-containing protein [Leeia speluncae]
MPSLFLGLSILASSTVYAKDETYKLVHLVASEYPPTTSEKMPNGGLLDQKVKEAFRLAGYEVKVTFLPFARGYAMAKAGKFDGIYDLWMTPERAKDFLPSHSVHHSIFSIYGRSDDAYPPKFISQLKGHTVGLVSSYGYPNEISKGVLQLDYSNDDISIFRKVLMGRTDYAVATKERVDWLLQTDLSASKLRLYKTEIQLNNLDSVVGFPIHAPRSQELIKAFNKGLEQLNKEKPKKNMGKLISVSYQ